MTLNFGSQVGGSQQHHAQKNVKMPTYNIVVFGGMHMESIIANTALPTNQNMQVTTVVLK